MGLEAGELELGLDSGGEDEAAGVARRDGEQVGSVSVRVADDAERVILTYQWTPYNGEPRHVDCTLRIERTPCNYGGARPWILCPSCGRRCAVVYFGAPGGRYACRHCARVGYLSQCEDEMGRLWLKQRKVEERCRLRGRATRRSSSSR